MMCSVWRMEANVIKVHIDISDTPLKTQPVRRLPFAVHQEVAQ